jgi:protocatechuate 3,4-dioxygenase beta subunit
MANPATQIANTKSAPVGQVIDCVGTPVASAEVWLYYSASYWGLDDHLVEKVISGAKGHFAFTQPLTFKTPNGTDRHDHYILIATHDGLAPAWTRIVGGTQEQRDFQLQLTKPVSQTFEVVDLNGQPVEGATIWLRHASAQANKTPFFADALSLPHDLGIFHAVTDGTGTATIVNLPDTQRTMAVSKQGFEDEIGGHPTESSLCFKLKPGATLEGRVTDPLGLPVEEATVWLYPKFGWNMYFMARTDKDGRYRIEKIWSNGEKKDWGKYQVGIRSSRFTAATREVAFSSGQNISGYDISATSGTEIVGKLLDPATEQPVAGAEVYIDGSSGRQTRRTDPNGQFRCRVMEDTVRIFFGLPPGGTFVIDERSRDSKSSVQTRAFGPELPVTLYTPSALGKLGTLRGKVVDATGRPQPFCHVIPAVTDTPRTRILTSGWKGNIFRGVYTQDDGTFTLVFPVGFAFTLTATTPTGNESGISSAKLSTDPFDLPDPIVLQSTRSADLILTDLSGTPRPNFAVDVIPQAKGVDLWLNKKEYKTDARGNLHLENIAPGLTYRIAQGDSEYAWTTFDPINQTDGRGVTKLLITDRCILRVVDSSGQTIPIKYLKEFFVWILNHGKRVQWTHTWPDNDTLEKLGADVTLPCKYIVLAKPGEQVDMLLETESGALVRATSSVPSAGSAVLLAQVTEMSDQGYEADPSLEPVQSDEVAGRVVDPEGNPVAGATVTFNGVYWNDAGSAQGQTNGTWRREPTFTTDSDGIFRASPAKDQWFLYETIFKEGYAPIFLTDIPRGKGFVVKLQNTTRLAGTIGGDRPGKVSLLLEKDKDTIRAEMGNQVRSIQYRTETDENGTYNFPMEPGTYRFKAVSVGGRFAVGEVTAIPGQTVSIPATLLLGVPVTLRLIVCQTGQSVAGIEVGIMEKRADGIYTQRDGSSRTSDDRGELHWDNLMPGKTQFTSRRMTHVMFNEKQHPYVRWWRSDYGYRSYPGQSPDSGNVDYSRNPPTKRDGVGDLFVDVQEGIEPLVILLEKGVKVSGTVFGPDDAAQKGAHVGVVPNDGYSETLTGDSRFTLPTDDQGRFSGYLPAGNGTVYNLCAYYRPEFPPSLANAVSEPFASKPGEELTFHLKMLKGGWVTGKILGSDGNPVEGLKVTATNSDRMDLAYAKRIATPDREGNFRLGPLRPGHYTVQYGQGRGVPLRVERPTATNSKEEDVADGLTKDVGTLIIVET